MTAVGSQLVVRVGVLSEDWLLLAAAGMFGPEGWRFNGSRGSGLTSL